MLRIFYLGFGVAPTRKKNKKTHLQVGDEALQQSSVRVQDEHGDLADVPADERVLLDSLEQGGNGVREEQEESTNNFHRRQRWKTRRRREERSVVSAADLTEWTKILVHTRGSFRALAAPLSNLGASAKFNRGLDRGGKRLGEGERGGLERGGRAEFFDDG